MAQKKIKFLAILNSCHPIPCLAVSSFAGMLAYASGLPIDRCLWIFFAVLFHQFSVGFSNDWLDAAKDKEAQRTDKPTVNGTVRPSLLRSLALSSVAVAVLITLGLGLWATLLMIFMLVVGWSYNLGMKSTWASVIPYAVGFGSIPLFVELAAPSPSVAPGWTVIVAALLGISAHFANVLPDIEADKLTGVNALPHIMGQRASALVISSSALLATALVVTQSAGLDPAFAVAGLALVVPVVLIASLLSLRPRPPRIVFPLLMAAALVNVVLLMLSSGF